MSVAVERTTMVWVPRGTFTMGSDADAPEERPAHRVRVDGFWMDRHPVTNAEYAAFVDATGYVTVAERPLDPADYPGVDPGALVPGAAVFRQPGGPVDLGDPGSWWAYVPGACWRRPEGPDSSLVGRDEHPVVNVAFEDAGAYAQWAGKRLPTEAQWERAARGGPEGRAFSWGAVTHAAGRPLANIWEGEFPWRNAKPHPPGPEPVGSYPPTGFGLHDLIGNVWEWTTDFYREGHAKGSCCGGARNPTGPATAIAEPATPGIPLMVLKGGSFLCAPNYCARYRPSARIPQAADSAAVNVGFRCVAAARGTGLR